MSSISTLRASCFAVCLAAAGVGQASTFSLPKLPEYSNPLAVGISAEIGTFSLTLLPGESVTSATITGFFGNSKSDSTSGVDIYADNVKIASCVSLDVLEEGCSMNFSGHPLSWSHTFSGKELDIFADGKVVLTALSTDCCVVRLGETELHGVAAVPEPETYALILSGLASLAWVQRRRSA